jgi:hypothetical protein
MSSLYRCSHCTFLLLLAAAFAASPALGQKLHPRMKQGDSIVNRVVILPVSVTLTKSGMKGGEPMEKEAAEAAPIIERAIAKAMIEKKLFVLDSPFKPEALLADEKLKYAAADLQRKYHELYIKMRRKQKDIEKGRFTLGDEVLLLNQDDNIDAFLFVDVHGQRKSKGMKTLGAITMAPILMLSTYIISVGIADARTGDILAYNQAASIFDITKPEDKRLVEMLNKMFKKLPAGRGPEAVVEKP